MSPRALCGPVPGSPCCQLPCVSHPDGCSKVRVTRAPVGLRRPVPLCPVCGCPAEHRRGQWWGVWGGPYQVRLPWGPFFSEPHPLRSPWVLGLVRPELFCEWPSPLPGLQPLACHSWSLLSVSQTCSLPQAPFDSALEQVNAGLGRGHPCAGHRGPRHQRQFLTGPPLGLGSPEADADTSVL